MKHSVDHDGPILVILIAVIIFVIGIITGGLLFLYFFRPPQ